LIFLVLVAKAHPSGHAPFFMPGPAFLPPCIFRV
jgi:hypothetical protein